MCRLGGTSNKISLSVAPFRLGVGIGVVNRDSPSVPDGVGWLNVSNGCHSSFSSGSRGGVCGFPMVAQVHVGGSLP